MAGVNGASRLPPKLPPNTFGRGANDCSAAGPRGFAGSYGLGSSASPAHLTSTRIGRSATVPIFAYGNTAASDFFTYSPEETGLKRWLRVNTELDAVVQTMLGDGEYESPLERASAMKGVERDVLRALVKALRRHFKQTTGFLHIENPQRQLARAWITDAHRLSNRLQLKVLSKPFLNWFGVDRFFDVQARVLWNGQWQLTKVAKKNRDWVRRVDGPPAKDQDGKQIWMSEWHRIESGLTGIVKADQGRIAQWLTPDGLSDLLMAAQSVDVANEFLLAISSIALTGRKPNVAMPSGVAKTPFPAFFDGLDPQHQTFSFGTTPAFLGGLLRGFQEKAEIVLDRWAATAGILTPWCRDRAELGQRRMRMQLVGEDRRRMQDVIEQHYQRISAAIAGAGAGYNPAYVGPTIDMIWRDFGKRAAVEALVTLLIARGFVSPSFRESYVQFIGARALEEAANRRDGFNGSVRRLVATSAGASNDDMKGRLSDLGIIPPARMIPDHDRPTAIASGENLFHFPVRSTAPSAAAASPEQGAKVYMFPSRTPPPPRAA